MYIYFEFIHYLMPSIRNQIQSYHESIHANIFKKEYDGYAEVMHLKT